MAERTWTKCAVWAALLGVVTHLALVPLVETDLFFHLKLGQLIVERHAIPFINLFSFTYPAHADPDLCWAFQVLVAGVYGAAGFSGIVVLKTALIVAAAAVGVGAARIVAQEAIGDATRGLTVACAAELEAAVAAQVGVGASRVRDLLSSPHLADDAASVLRLRRAVLKGWT